MDEIHRQHGALIVARLPEELSKFLMLLVSILIFRSRLRNVYEGTSCWGQASALGFTIFEEYLYSDSEPAAPDFPALSDCAAPDLQHDHGLSLRHGAVPAADPHGLPLLELYSGLPRSHCHAHPV